MIIAVLKVHFAIIGAVFRHIDDGFLIIGVCRQTDGVTEVTPSFLESADLPAFLNIKCFTTTGAFGSAFSC